MTTLLVALLPHPAGAQDASTPPAPTVHWPLSGHATESVRGAITTVHGKVDFPSTNSGASFRGPESWLEMPAAQVPALGTTDFTLSVWLQSDEANGFIPGDLVSQYDTTRRRGFHLTLKSNPGVTSNQSNWRHLHFGIDDDRASAWRDCGRPGQALFAFALAAHQGAVYAGTCEPGLGQSGRVYRYAGGTNWVDCGAPDGANSVTSFAVHQGSLYAGTGKYRVAGSSLPESPNTTLGGQIFRYLGTNQWLHCGQLPSTEAVGGMVVFRGSLYASSLYKPAGFFRYEGGTQWTGCGTPDGTRVVPLTVHDNFLYAGSYDRGHVYRYDGRAWVDCGPLADNTQTYSFTSYEGRLLVGTWPSGRVYRFDDIGRWSDLGRLGQELEVMGMAVHNGRLIAGTLPLAEVHSYEGGTEWKRLAQLDTTPDVKYRRAWTVTEHQGALFCSTLPSGKVFAFSAGLQVTHDHSLSSDWHHVAVVKSADTLKLYLDGRLVSESARWIGEPIDLRSEAPWRIGAGKNGPFNGQLADFRVYRQALPPDAIRTLASAAPAARPIHTLQADKTWLLNLPQGQRLDASALLRRPDGSLLTVNDQDSVVYRMHFQEGTNAIDLTPLPECLTRQQLAPFAAQKFKRYDLEGLAQDSQGRLYVCEEGNRWILRWDPKTLKVDRLNIDWKPVERWFSAADPNASLEGIAIGGDRLYVANERQIGRLIVVDLTTLKVIDDFMVAPAGSQSTDVHYTDLCWADDALWVLLRDDRKLLKVDPTAKRVLAEFDFTAMERSRENAYGALFAPGFMEGVSVDQDFIWLLSDNNGMGRKAKLSDKRPTLFRCPKPQ